MKPGGLPTVIDHKGKTTQKPKLSLAARVANNSQKKIDTITRFYDLEMIICEGSYKKNSHLLKKQIASYQKSLSEAKERRQRTAGTRVFITQPSAREKLDLTLNRQSATPAEDKQPPKPKYGDFINCDPEAIGSIRRKTKTLLTSSVSKSISDLYRLRDKHVLEYKEAVAEMRKLQSRFDLPFEFDVACRSYTPFTAGALPLSPIIISLRNKIKHSEIELQKLQKKLKDLSNKSRRAQTTKPTTSNEDDEEEVDKQSKEETFKVFCDKKGGELGEDQRPITTNLPRLLSRRNSRTVKFDLEKMKSDGSISSSMLNLLTSNSKNSTIEIIDNPFDTGEIAPQTRSRLLIESKKNDNMYMWLGFKSQAQLEAAMKENPSRIKQIPAALLSLVEEPEESDAEEGDIDEGSESESENDAVDEDDLRFKVFDERKFKRKREVLKPT